MLITPAKSGDIPSLDGLRAVAIGLVLVSHLDPMIGQIVPAGLGLTVFFFLSGFLITTLLRQEFAQYGDIAIRNFYLRRGLRLLPLLYLVTAVSALAAHAGLIRGQVTLEGLLSIVFYWGNYFITLHSYHGIPHGLGVVWSLAIEEHFYLAWPILFLWLARKRLSSKAWVAVIAGLCLLPLLLRLLAAIAFDADPRYLDHATEMRFDGLMYGCLLAMVCNPWLDPVPAQRPRLEFAILVAALLVIVASLLYRNSLFRGSFRYSVQSLALLPIFWLAIARADWWPFRPLNSALLRYIGQISYGLYLIHLLVIFAVLHQLPSWSLAARSVLAVSLILLVCELLRRTIENPLGRLRKRLHRQANPTPLAEPAR